MPASLSLLAGDVGGTHTRLVWLRTRPEGGFDEVRRSVYPSAAFPTLTEILRRFRDETGGDFGAAGLGVPGPVRGHRAKITNLPWVVDAGEIAATLELPAVALVNDLEAHAWGLPLLSAGDFVTLAEGERDPHGNAALIAAGTGLGEAGLAWTGSDHHPFATEGGHSSFAPGNELEIELLRYLWRLPEHLGHVSWERLVSGPGLVTLFEFLCSHRRAQVPPSLGEALREAGDRAAVISGEALAGGFELAVEALGLFVRLYGAEAGNLALKVMATGGVFVGGAIAAKILPALQGPSFLEAFRAKGRMRPLLEAMPVRVVTNEAAGLLGAARVAVRAAMQGPGGGIGSSR
ncbi:MAG TPA: glucokinase [Thermoanaerobaculia bacterium]|nr:glucokinase [Thermoanaerobaculia bacterium]